MQSGAFGMRAAPPLADQSVRTLLIGGVRSGKSRRAQALGLAFERQSRARAVIMIATATPGDEEMRLRIEAHRAARPPSWTTIEEPRRLGTVFRHLDHPGRLVIVDCLTLWLTNLLLDRDACSLRSETESLLQAIEHARGAVVLVANETGLGTVPADALARRFNDEAGQLHQSLAALCERVELVVSGVPLILKPRPDRSGAQT